MPLVKFSDDDHTSEFVREYANAWEKELGKCNVELYTEKEYIEKIRNVRMNDPPILATSQV